MFLPKGATFRDFFTALGKVSITAVKSVLTAAKTIAPSPSLKIPPNGANPKAVEKHWRDFYTKYESVWGKYKKDVERQWACCVAIWVNYCLKRKIQPFDANAATVTNETRDKIENRTENARVTQLDAIDSLLSKGARKGIISKCLKETFVSLDEKKPGEFTVLTKRAIVLEKGVEFNSPQFKLFMDKSNFQRKAGRYVRPTKTNTEVIVQMDEDLNRPVLILRNVLTKAYSEMLLGLPEKKDNKEAVKKLLIKYWKSLIRDLT